MSLRTKQILVAVGVLLLVGLGSAIGWWRDHQVPSEATPEPTQSTHETPKQPEDQADAPTPQSGIQTTTKPPEEAAPVGVCAVEGKAALDHYFTAQTAAPEAWRDELNSLLSETGRTEQDLIDQTLILQQAQVGWPASAEPDPQVGVIYCEGLSDLTGWFIQLSRASTDEPWLVDSIRAFEPTRGYAPPRSVTEE